MHLINLPESEIEEFIEKTKQDFHEKNGIVDSGFTQADLINNFSTAGQQSYNEGNYDASEMFFSSSVFLAQKLAGEDHPDFAIHLNNLASVYKSQSKYEEAEKLYLKALEITKKVLGEDHPKFATVLNNLAGVYYYQEKYPEAEKKYLQALEIKKHESPKNHASIADSLNGIALVYEAEGKYEEAEKIYLQALEITKQTLGEDRPGFAVRLNNLGTLYYEWGKKENDRSKLILAEKNISQALDIFTTKIGANHQYTEKTQSLLDDVNREIEKGE